MPGQKEFVFASARWTDHYGAFFRRLPAPSPCPIPFHCRPTRRAPLRQPAEPGPAAPVPGGAQEHEVLYQVFEQTPAAICIQRGPAHRYTYCNAAYQAFFPGRQLRGRTVAEALPETVAAGFVGLLDDVFRTGTTFFGTEMPLTLAQSDVLGDRQMYFTFTYQAYREHGQIVGISTFAYDVTAQVLARRQHRAQEQQLRELFEQAPVAIAVFRGPRYVVEMANPAVCAMWGRTPAQAVGTPLFELLPEAAGQGFEGLLDGVLRTGQPYVAHELPSFIDRAGRRDTVYWNFVYHPLREADGRITGITVVATEVTEQVRARQQAAARQVSEAAAARLRLLTDALPALIGYVDREGRYQFANQAYEAWFNQKPEELVGRTVREVVGEGAYAQAQGYIARALAGERLDFEARMPYRPNFVKHIRTSFVPDRQDGQVIGFYSLVTDVSEQVEARQLVEQSGRQVQALNERLSALNHKLYAANAALAEANEELGHSNDRLDGTNQQLTHTNEELDTFVYTASHDLQTPITNLEGLLHALREELPADSQVGPAAHILGLMADSVGRFQQTLGQLAAIARLQAEPGGAPPAALAEVVRDVLLDLAGPIAAAGAQLVVEVAACPSLPLSENNLRSVVFNLVSNALKYHHPDRAPRVWVRGQARHQSVVLEVQDNGLGLDLTHERPLFGLFQRFHTHVDGSGVGLYMVKKMVENAGGAITVQSQLGEGSTFTVSFEL